MDTELLIDFESAIGSVAEVYFLTGFVTGVIVCALVVAIVVALTR